MELQEMLSILDNAIEGRPNSTLSEHSRRLQQVRDSLASGPHVVADAPSAPPPRLAKFFVDIVLSEEYEAVDEDEAWEMALSHISSRKGMMITSHKIRRLNPPPEGFL